MTTQSERELLMPGTFADYFGQRWKVGAVGVTGCERYYWLWRFGVALMAPATMVKAWTGRAAAALAKED